MQLRRELNALASNLLRDGGGPTDHRQAAEDLYDFLNQLAGRPQDVRGVEANPWQRETLLPTGKAINPYSAATCILDALRTRCFALGLRQAIRAAQARFPGERIELLYAGTGPFAPLALLQTAFFSPREIGFSLIDIHQPALDCLGNVLKRLGLQEYVQDWFRADATTWSPPAAETYHVIVAEVMEQALTQEPQVAATMNLARYLREGGVFVPETVELSLRLFDPESDFQQLKAGRREHLTLKNASTEAVPLFRLTQAGCRDYSVKDNRISLPAVRMPTGFPPGYTPCISTRIITFGDISLDEYDSGLTQPVILRELSGIGSAMLEAWYAIGPHPGLQLIPLDQPRAA